MSLMRLRDVMLLYLLRSPLSAFFKIILLI